VIILVVAAAADFLHVLIMHRNKRYRQLQKITILTYMNGNVNDGGCMTKVTASKHQSIKYANNKNKTMKRSIN